MIKSFLREFNFANQRKKTFLKGFNFVIEIAVCEVRQKFLPLKYRVCNSRVEICHTFKEISLNLMDFADFFYIEMLTNSFSLTSGNALSLPLVHKACTVLAKK